MIKRNYKFYFALGIVLIFFISNTGIGGPYFLDEGGYLANAAYLSGNKLDAASSYYAGYSLFLTPAFWISHDPHVEFVFVKLINSIMWGISALLVISLLQFVFPTAGEWKIMGASMVALFYPAWISFSGYALSENAFVLFFLLSVYLAFRVVQTGKAWWLAWAVSLGYLFCIHPRAAPVIGAALLSSILIAKARKDWYWLLIFSTIVIGLVLFYWLILEPNLINNMTIGDYPPLLHYESPGKLLNSIFSIQRVRDFIVRASGELFYITLATLGLVFYPFFRGIIYFRSDIKKKTLEEMTVTGNRPVYIFLAVSFLGTLILSALSLGGGPRFDHWLYGRYLEGVTLPFLAMGIFLFSKRKAFLSIIVLAMMAMILILFMPTKLDSIVITNELGLWQAILLGYPVGGNANLTILFWSISGFFLILISILFKNSRYRVYFFILIYVFTIALQINNQVQLAKFYGYPKVEILDYVRQKYPAGSCVAINDGSELKGNLYVYAFYLQEYKFIRLNLPDWFNKCNGPLLSTNTNINKDYPASVASIYNYADNLIVWDKLDHEQKANCLPNECINIITKSYPFMQAGEYFTKGVRSNGKKGYLLFGPYVRMESGAYILEIKGVRPESEGQILVGVVGNQGEHTFAYFDESNNLSQPESGILLRKKVILDKAVDDLEVRVWVDGKATVEIYGYSLRHDH
jgi:hypothetical protein